MILGVPNDLNCAHVLASALRMGITTASTELMHNFTDTRYILLGLRAREGVIDCAQSWSRATHFIWTKTRGVPLLYYRGHLSSVI